jgi:hypothetical protein
VSSHMPECELVAGSPDRCSRGRECIPSSIIDGEKLWKGDRRLGLSRWERDTCERDALGSSRLCRSGWEPARIR